jgi:hypothetical protein
MRENRLYGSEGGVAKAIPTPIRFCARRQLELWVGAKKRTYPGRTKKLELQENG